MAPITSSEKAPAAKASFAKPVVVRLRAETIVLVVAATAVTLALANTVHSRQEDLRQQASASQAATVVADAGQTWAGALTDLAAASGRSEEPLSSASLVVSKSELALPKVAVRPLVRLRGCEGSLCGTKTAAASAAVVRRGAGDAPVAPRRSPGRERQSLIARLNPLRHLPDMSAIRRPFASAGDAVSGWFRRF